ncbi:MAG TPA: hypothetical protein VFD58_31795 [Blastocatellia bacterium]|nr:hypothetical protein [Blastocatellia bacterium]
MLVQMLAIAAALGLTYLLLRLRHSIGGDCPDKRKHGVYIMNFDGGDRSMDRDEDLTIWPQEIELQPDHSTAQAAGQKVEAQK